MNNNNIIDNNTTPTSFENNYNITTTNYFNNYLFIPNNIYILLNTNNIINTLTSITFSISFWFKPNIDTGEYILGGQDSTLGYGLYIKYDNINSKIIFGKSINNSFVESISQSILNINNWFNIVVISTLTKIKIYINGVLDVEEDITGTHTESTNSVKFSIGHNYIFDAEPDDTNNSIDINGQVIPNNANFNIADLRIYNIELSSNYINDIYNDTDFKTKYNIQFNYDIYADVLLVGGGGGGGYSQSSTVIPRGGQGGEVKYINVLFKKDKLYSIKVGKGGDSAMSGHDTSINNLIAKGGISGESYQKGINLSGTGTGSIGKQTLYFSVWTTDYSYMTATEKSSGNSYTCFPNFHLMAEDNMFLWCYHTYQYISLGPNYKGYSNSQFYPTASYVNGHNYTFLVEKRPDLLAWKTFSTNILLNYSYDTSDTSYATNWAYTTFYGWVGPINHRTSVYFMPSYHQHHARVMKQWVGGTGLVSTSTVNDWKLRDKELYNYNDYKIQWPNNINDTNWLYTWGSSYAYGHYYSWNSTSNSYWGYFIGAVISPTNSSGTQDNCYWNPHYVGNAIRVQKISYTRSYYNWDGIIGYIGSSSNSFSNTGGSYCWRGTKGSTTENGGECLSSYHTNSRVITGDGKYLLIADSDNNRIIIRRAQYYSNYYNYPFVCCWGGLTDQQFTTSQSTNTYPSTYGVHDNINQCSQKRSLVYNKNATNESDYPNLWNGDSETDPLGFAYVHSITTHDYLTYRLIIVSDGGSYNKFMNMAWSYSYTNSYSYAYNMNYTMYGSTANSPGLGTGTYQNGIETRIRTFIIYPNEDGIYDDQSMMNPKCIHTYWCNHPPKGADVGTEYPSEGLNINTEIDKQWDENAEIDTGTTYHPINAEHTTNNYSYRMHWEWCPQHMEISQSGKFLYVSTIYGAGHRSKGDSQLANTYEGSTRGGSYGNKGLICFRLYYDNENDPLEERMGVGGEATTDGAEATGIEGTSFGGYASGSYIYNELGTIGESEDSPSPFDNPNGIVLISNKLYVSNTDNNEIRIYDKDTLTEDTVISAIETSMAPFNLAKTSTHLYMVDNYYNCIRKIDITNTTNTSVIGTSNTTDSYLENKLYTPRGIAVSEDGKRMYITDSNRLLIYRDNDDGNGLVEVNVIQHELYNIHISANYGGNGFNTPHGVHMLETTSYNEDIIIVADKLYNRIKIYKVAYLNNTYELLKYWGGSQYGGAFNNTLSITSTSYNNKNYVFISDIDKIYMYLIDQNYNGTYKNFLGYGDVYQMDISEDGETLYIVQNSSHKVTKINLLEIYLFETKRNGIFKYNSELFSQRYGLNTISGEKTNNLELYYGGDGADGYDPAFENIITEGGLGGGADNTNQEPYYNNGLDNTGGGGSGGYNGSLGGQGGSGVAIIRYRNLISEAIANETTYTKAIIEPERILPINIGATDYAYYAFTNIENIENHKEYSITFASDTDVSILVVGGGGGGGGSEGIEDTLLYTTGGGEGGQVKYEEKTLKANIEYQIKVGRGGNGGEVGKNSLIESLNDIDFVSIESNGGNSGTNITFTIDNSSGEDVIVLSGGVSTDGVSNDGSVGIKEIIYNSTTINLYNKFGEDNMYGEISLTEKYFGGNGADGYSRNNSIGGLGGGADNTNIYPYHNDGLINTGGGGSGGNYGSKGGKGGSGIILIRYKYK